MNPIKILSIIIIAVCLIASSSCNPKNSNRHCYDVEELKKSFEGIRDLDAISVYKNSLCKNLEGDTKTIDQIITEYGEPIKEYTDTFRYGLFVNKGNLDLGIDRYYDLFPDTLWKIPLLIIKKCIWPQGNKDVTLFFLNDCHKGEQPICGYITEYDADYLPLRLLAEKTSSPNEITKKRGLPDYEKTYEVFNGVDYSYMEEIYCLRDVPVATVHSYRWKADSIRSLIMIYMEDDDKDTAKPIWGFQIHDGRLLFD